MTDHESDTSVEPSTGPPRHVGPGIDWRTSPIDRTGWLMMLATFLVSTTVLTIIGFAMLEWWDGSAAGRRDADLIRWLEDQRTESRTSAAELVSLASDTLTKVIVGVALAALGVPLVRAAELLRELPLWAEVTALGLLGLPAQRGM